MARRVAIGVPMYQMRGNGVIDSVRKIVPINGLPVMMRKRVSSGVKVGAGRRRKRMSGGARGKKKVLLRKF